MYRFSILPLCREERLFIEAMRDLNYQASRLQQVESQASSAGLNITSDDSTHASANALEELAVSNALESAIDKIGPMSLAPTISALPLSVSMLQAERFVDQKVKQFVKHHPTAITSAQSAPTPSLTQASCDADFSNDDAADAAEAIKRRRLE